MDGLYCSILPLVGSPIVMQVSSLTLDRMAQGKMDFDPNLLLGAAREGEATNCLKLDLESYFQADSLSYHHAMVPDYEYCWRTLLSEQWSILDQKLLRLVAELEFNVFGSNSQRRAFFSHILHLGEKLGLGLECVRQELGRDQFEIKLENKDPRRFLDQFYLSRYLIQKLAEEYQLKVSFLPKSSNDDFGNGVHFKFKIADAQLANELGTFFVNHAYGLSLLFNCSVNSFKRLHFGKEAPRWICLGPLKYMPLIAIEKQVLEFRGSDHFVNLPAFFYVLAKVLQNKSFLKESLFHLPLEKNPKEMSYRDRSRFKIKIMPDDLGESIRSFRLDKDLLSIFGKNRHEKMIEIASHDWQSFLQVTHAWEEDHYSRIWK